VGRALEEGRDPRSVLDDDVLDRAVSDMRDARMLPSIETSRQMRAQILESVAASRPPARIYHIATVVRWAGVAAMLLAGLLGYYFLTSPVTQQAAVYEAGAAPMEIVLDDGSEVVLRPRAILAAIRASGSERHYRLEGEARFTVIEERRDFVVDTPDGRVRVLGTTFVVRTWRGATEVYLESGSLAVESSDAARFGELNPGEVARLTSDVLEITPAAETLQFTSWMHGVLEFRDRRAADLAAEISYHFGVNVTIDGTLAEEHLSGSVGLHDLDETLHDIALVLGAEVQPDGRSAYRLIRP
jgi:ferric-dicitrate binding protein FerR (iron transport regulator)